MPFINFAIFVMWMNCVFSAIISGYFAASVCARNACKAASVSSGASSGRKWPPEHYVRLHYGHRRAIWRVHQISCQQSLSHPIRQAPVYPASGLYLRGHGQDRCLPPHGNLRNLHEWWLAGGNSVYILLQPRAYAPQASCPNGQVFLQIKFSISPDKLFWQRCRLGQKNQ